MATSRRPRRVPVLERTRATVETALDVAYELLEDGPGAVTAEKVAEAVGRSKSWASRYLGAREDILRAVVVREIDVIEAELKALPLGQLDARKRIRAVLEVVIGPARTMESRLWTLVVASSLGLGQRGILAKEISGAVAAVIGRFSQGIGGGILGVLAEAVGGGWHPERAELLSIATDMTVAVHLFAVASARRFDAK